MCGRWKFHRSPTLLRLELLLWAGGALCLGIYGYYWLERSIVQSSYLSAVDQPISPTTSGPAAREAFFGKIEIPRLGMSAAVLEGVDDKTLRNAVGHVPGSAVPGKNGRVALAGHRDTFFRDLQHVRLSDTIRITAALAQYEYKVTSTQIVSPDRIDVISATSEPRLTLVTCYPFSYIGRAPLRFIVHADPIPPLQVKSASLAPRKPAAQHAARRARKPVLRQDRPIVQPEPEIVAAVDPQPEERRKVLRALAAPFKKAFGWMR